MHVASSAIFLLPYKKFSFFLWGPGWINQMLFMLGFSLQFPVLSCPHEPAYDFSLPPSVLPTLPGIS